MIFKTILSNIFQQTKNISTKMYIMIYILFIVIFSIIYTMMPNESFYHSTSKYEKNVLNDEASEITNDLFNVIKNDFDSFYNSSQTTINKWQVNSKNFQIHSLNIDNYPNSISFTLSVDYQYIEPDIRTYVPYNLTLNLQETSRYDNKVILYINSDTKNYTDSIEGINKQPTLSDIFPDHNHVTSMFLHMPIKLYEKINNFGTAYLGFPSKIKNHFMRMLYFSSTIATSNALGDIVPLTNFSRFIVTLESLIMLILITLFLSSLAEKIIKKE